MKYKNYLYIYCISYLSDYSRKNLVVITYDRLWKLRIHFESLNDPFGKFYGTPECWALKFKDLVIFKDCIHHASLENRDYGRSGSAALTMRHPYIRKS
jgi:hypothetical protein